ncbi:DUF951 domain-containing protein [Natranaerobius thermophilus]|uniref:DUF951 domain-containing protein n=1 Tax=Natranaerobius thermophilus (strain ATCC BAA-1301 / DSM 18059 / JW/NM-WN-LF) TaxID=457570 RepID=B2A458_NATTJ|nr:DUF951 domain-containing protein [Natranaerobius thermophilus]ACB86464.1 protein of unknown function DUF951 [Natranaerobius thermophilus JW/NM-WN-LF]
MEYDLNQVVRMKKPHPCGANLWKIIRLGADIRIKCLNCGRSVMIPRAKFEKRVKKILSQDEIDQGLSELKEKN